MPRGQLTGMRRLLMVALLLTGCGPKSPAGVWVQQRSSCEILSDNTVVFTEVKDVQVQGFRYGQKFSEMRPQTTLFLGQLDLKDQPATVTLHSPSVMGKVPVRELKLELQPGQRQLKVDGQVWSEKPLMPDKNLCGWWKQKNVSHWVLLTPGGSLVQIGTVLRRTGTSNYNSWDWLVGEGARYEVSQGKFILIVDTDQKIETTFEQKGDDVKMMSDQYERVKTPFRLSWDQDGHPQVP